MPIRAHVESADAVMHDGKLFGHNLVLAAVAGSEAGNLNGADALLAGGGSRKYKLSIHVSLDEIDYLAPTPPCSSAQEGSGAPPGVPSFHGVARRVELRWESVQLGVGSRIHVPLARRNGVANTRMRICVQAQPRDGAAEKPVAEILSF